MTENMVECTAGPLELLELRTMGDPCPRCGGTDYYCAEEADRHIEHLQAELELLHESLRETRNTAAEYANVAREAHAEIERLRATLRRLLAALAGEYHPVILNDGRRGYMTHLPSDDGFVCVQVGGWNIACPLTELTLVA